MRVGIIDLGTNSVRFDVYQIGQKKQTEQLHREKLMVRLGQGVFLNGTLSQDAITRTLQAFVSFKTTAKHLNVEKITAFATSALREASDSERLLKLIYKKSGISVRIISGDDEAKLIAQGILKNELLPQKKFGLVDIGGGSTEISICLNKRILKAHSFPLGTARLQQVFLKSSPPKAPTKKGEKHPITVLRSYIRNELGQITIPKNWPDVSQMIGSSGTVLALCKLLKKPSKKNDHPFLDRKELKKIVKTMSQMNTSQLLTLPGMEAKRVDMILAGAILLEEVMDHFNAKRVFSTSIALRDGIFEEELKLFKEKKFSPLSLHLIDLRKKAKILGAHEGHLEQVTKLTEKLFDKLMSLHKLKPFWKTYLTAAALLHDIGTAVNPSSHEVHSYYFVKHMDMPSLQEWEREFIAQLCLRHRGGKVPLKDIAILGHPMQKNAFLKLLALLRIADALDRHHRAKVIIRRIKTDRKQVTITISGNGSSELVGLRVEQKKDLFEKIFKRTLLIKH